MSLLGFYAASVLTEPLSFRGVLGYHWTPRGVELACGDGEGYPNTAHYAHNSSFVALYSLAPNARIY